MTEIEDKVITRDAFELPCTVIKVKHQPTKGAIAYIHGGGLMFGRASGLSPRRINILTEHYDLIQLSYRLLPEVDLGCIIDDIFTSFDAIQSRYSNYPTFTSGRSSDVYLGLLIARNRDIDGATNFYDYGGINTEPFKMTNDYYAKIAQSVNETVFAQLTLPTPIIQDQIAQHFLIYGYAHGTGEWINMINIVDYTDSGYSTPPNELRTLSLVFIAHCSGDYDAPVEESEHIRNRAPHPAFERVNENKHNFDHRPNDEAITIYRRVVGFLNAVIMA